MAMKLYELCGADEGRRFSPYCWRVRVALALKGLHADAVPWRFTEKDAIAMSGQGRVPVLVDGDRVIHDSWAIAEYLEETYAGQGLPLFDGPMSKASLRFLDAWAGLALHSSLVGIILTDVYAVLHDKDRDYFRTTREAFLGKPLEEVCAGRETRIEGFRRGLEPLRLTLKQQPWLGGAEPAYADAIVFGALQWARMTSPLQLLADDDVVKDWRDRLTARYPADLASPLVLGA